MDKFAFNIDKNIEAGRFKDKVVLVTGAARNTGLAIAEAFASEGSIVALNGRNPEAVTFQASRLREMYGLTVIEVPADISCQQRGYRRDYPCYGT